MDPITLALIMAGLTTAGGIATTALNNNSIKETNQQNIDNQWAMWNATNQYNTPHEQMLRYAEAGLNPNLIYGQSNTTSPVNVGVAQPLNFNGLNDIIPNVMQSLLTASQIRTNDANVELTKQNTLTKVYENAVNPEMFEEKLKLTRNQAYHELRQIMNTIQSYQIGETEKALKQLEQQSKQLGYNYDKSQAEAGFPPDLDPRDRGFLGLLGSLLEWLSNGKIDSSKLVNAIFNTPNY